MASASKARPEETKKREPANTSHRNEEASSSADPDGATQAGHNSGDSHLAGDEESGNL